MLGIIKVDDNSVTALSEAERFSDLNNQQQASIDAEALVEAPTNTVDPIDIYSHCSAPLYTSGFGV